MLLNTYPINLSFNSTMYLLLMFFLFFVFGYFKGYCYLKGYCYAEFNEFKGIYWAISKIKLLFLILFPIPLIPYIYSIQVENDTAMKNIRNGNIFNSITWVLFMIIVCILLFYFIRTYAN